jgi:hypothetical protein
VIASAGRFLVSPAAACVTEEMLAVDGGQVLGRDVLPRLEETGRDRSP